jgi:hypothetical protein
VEITKNQIRQKKSWADGGPAGVQKSHLPRLKARVAIEAIKGQKTTTQIEQMFGVHLSWVGGWKKQALTGLPGIFGHGPPAGQCGQGRTPASRVRTVLSYSRTCVGGR